ncbi:PfkB family carbohydrate kinase [Nocardioides flavescens]|uniref:Ribokinase n=1 Tax=Nocardioides flavescens TaxID=2691959 RepID=A0A6L7EX73_9ACTN|nr:PfkB family carbohydrate kinase [Nocardioides flavescens]MXG88251.1 ribokinase [Nocardioides flavescens]
MIAEESGAGGARGGATPAVAVVGSLNVDRVVPVRELPAPGATVIGTGASRLGPGGKGANQAAAAAAASGRPGAVVMVGAVGDDDGADLCLDDLAGRGVDTSRVRRVARVSTGLATVVLDDASQNLIVVDPGANAGLTPDDVRCDEVRDAAVVLLQLEVPTAAVLAAAAHATGEVVLNPAPSPGPDDVGELLAAADVLVPNRGELADLVGEPEASGVDGVVAQVRALPFDGVVVVTMGADGALVVAETVEHVEAPRVAAVDTTGAGDCFCGALAVGLAEGTPLLEAVRAAVRAAAESVTRPGAR